MQALDEYRHAKIIKDERGALPSASNADRWVNCEASHYANSWQESEAGEAAEMGTRLHEAMENCSPETLSDEDEITLFNFARHQLAQFDGDIIFKEERIGNKYYTGKPDLVLSLNGRVYIIDFKFGRIAKDATEALQLQALAALLLDEDDNSNWLTENHEGFTFVIIQPRVSSKPSIAEVSFQDIAKISFDLNIAARKATQGSKQKMAGDWCEYCAVRSLCKTAEEAALNTSFPDVDLTSKWEKIKVNEKLLSKMKSDVESELTKAIKSGEVTDYVLKQRKLGREINDMNAAWKNAKTAGVSQSAFISACKLTMGKLVESHAAEAEISKAEAKRRIDAALEEVSEDKFADKLTIEKVTR